MDTRLLWVKASYTAESKIPYVGLGVEIIFCVKKNVVKTICLENTVLYNVYILRVACTPNSPFSVRPPPPHSTGRRFLYAHGNHGFSLKLFQIAAEA